MKKTVPIEKVFEAWTALADNRVKIILPQGGMSRKTEAEEPHEETGEALVSSSDGEKSYTVKWKGDQYSSDDNATFWQGYPGYPVIAVMMKQGKLPYDSTQAHLWKNINWTQQNKKFKNNYAGAVAEIAKLRNIHLPNSYMEAEKVISKLKTLPIEIKRKIKV